MSNATSQVPFHARASEYVYVCVSEQMPGLFKVGETHRQTPEKRARQFTGVDKRVTWTVLRSFPTPDSRTTEKLVHTRLISLGAKVEGHQELFNLDASEIFKIIQESVARTPVKVAPRIAKQESVVVPMEEGPWQAALAMPWTYNGEKDFTLACIMALAAQGQPLLQRKLLDMGVQLVYPDPETPHYRIHSLTDTKWSKWLATQAISWEDLNIPKDGLSRKVRFQTMTGR